MTIAVLEQGETTFDYVIVGAGPSAMGLLYGLLSPFRETGTVPPFKIAIIERGSGPPHAPLAEAPHRWYEAAHEQHSGSSVTHIMSEITGRQMEIPIGKGLGGTSNVNASICTLPLPQDFESWPAPWSERILKGSKLLQTAMHENGCIHYGLENYSRDVACPFKEKAMDLSSRVPAMVAKKDWDDASNNNNGRFVRKNYHEALIKPFLEENPHLKTSITWFQGMEVQRLLVVSVEEAAAAAAAKHVDGVECYSYRLGQYLEIKAQREVILCTGTIETPVLLLTSGIGGGTTTTTGYDDDDNDIGDPLLSGVGRNLKDQVLLPRAYLAPSWRRRDQIISSNGVAALGHVYVGTRKVFQVAIVDAASHASILPSALAMAFRWHFPDTTRTSFWNWFFNLVYKIVKVVVRVAINYTPVGFFLCRCTTTALLFLLHPESTGRVEIIKPTSRSSSSLTEEPLRRRNVNIHVDVGYLKDQRDIDALWLLWEACSTMQKNDYWELFPGNLLPLLSRVSGIDWWASFCKNHCQGYFHYCGTCAMQTDDPGREDWVVDSSELRVRTYSGLRICDASVFPTCVSSPPSLTCAALGYSFGRLLFEKEMKHDKQ
jgi:choline dehydrogenase-like flavoprotein